MVHGSTFGGNTTHAFSVESAWARRMWRTLDWTRTRESAVERAILWGWKGLRDDMREKDGWDVGGEGRKDKR